MFVHKTCILRLYAFYEEELIGDKDWISSQSVLSVCNLLSLGKLKIYTDKKDNVGWDILYCIYKLKLLVAL